MPKRVRDPATDRRDWITRAAEAQNVAREMPEGPLRENALKKAAQLRSAGELMGVLMPDGADPAAADARQGVCKS